MWVVTVNSTAGSTYEASKPEWVKTGLTKEEAIELSEKINDSDEADEYSLVASYIEASDCPFEEWFEDKYGDNV